MTIVDGSGPYDERFEAIYRKYYARVWRGFRKNSIADDEAHDLAQDSFKRLLERMDQIRNDEPWPFLASIAKTILLNRVRARSAQKRSAPMVEIDDPDLVWAEPAAAEEKDYGEREAEEARRARLVAALAALTESKRECLRLWIQGFQYNEIAKILNISMDAVKSRIRDAKSFLRQQLGERP